jgi:hypothetical protein
MCIYIYIQSNTTINNDVIMCFTITVINVTTCFGLSRPSSGL